MRERVHARVCVRVVGGAFLSFVHTLGRTTTWTEEGTAQRATINPEASLESAAPGPCPPDAQSVRVLSLGSPGTLVSLRS